MNIARLAALGLTSLALSACASTIPAPSKTPATVPPPVNYAPNAYLGATGTGPAELMGLKASALVNLFGQPKLDVKEGAGRKLQFLNERCVLDTYLYAQKSGGDAVVAHAEARDRNGIDMPAVNCTALLRQR